MPSRLGSLRKQNLLVEFASLKHASPKGVYVSITPGNPSLWGGVLFIHEGPFAPSILRFQISFPSTYPEQPPLITFSTEIFHPLQTPLTTYTYTTSTSANETMSSSDLEILPPGGFSLRHGFPHWFSTSTGTSPKPKSSSLASVPVYEILDYLRYAFNDENCLNSIPLDAAANPGAYHAWQSYRAKRLRASSAVAPHSPNRSNRNSGIDNISGTLSSTRETIANRGRKPGEWNWEGVWEERVKRGTQASLAEHALFGSAGAAIEDLIRFAQFDQESMQKIMQELMSREKPNELQST